VSVRVMSLVWAINLPDSEKIVLLALADCANDEGHCWPGMKSLTKKCSKSERTIQGAVQSLVDKGHLTRREVFGKGCNYTVHPRSDCTPAETAPPQPATQTPAAAAGKPSKNHHSSEAKASSRRAKPKITFEAAYPDDSSKHNFRALCVQWAVAHHKWAVQDAGHEYDRFINRSLAHSAVYASWLAAWRNWCTAPYCTTKPAGSKDSEDWTERMGLGRRRSNG
jgi:hypothetical protein